MRFLLCILTAMLLYPGQHVVAETFSVSGRVLEADTSTPLAGVTISLHTWYDSEDDRVYFETTTDADGNYQISGDAPTNYYLSWYASLPSYTFEQVGSPVTNPDLQYEHQNPSHIGIPNTDGSPIVVTDRDFTAYKLAINSARILRRGSSWYLRIGLHEFGPTYSGGARIWVTFADQERSLGGMYQTLYKRRVTKTILIRKLNRKALKRNRSALIVHASDDDSGEILTETIPRSQIPR